MRRRWAGFVATALASVLPAAVGGVSNAHVQPVTACAVPPMAKPDPARPRYRVSADIDPTRRRVRGSVQVTFVPDLAVTELVFRVWPNGPDGETARGDWPPPHETVRHVTVDGHVAAVRRPDATTLVVKLGRTAKAGVPVDAAMSYELRLPGARNDRIASGAGWVRLGSFLPLLAWEPGVGWARTPPTTLHAETSLFPAADFSTTITAPTGYSVIATGERSPGTNRWDATAARDVGISAGRFRVATALADAGPTGRVEVSAAVAEALGDDAQAEADRTVTYLEELERRFGTYPWTTVGVAITPDLRGGIEYPGHVMLASGASPFVAAHEVAHQWFYGLVGNDQGRDPWLDEGLASWAQYRLTGDTGRLLERAAVSAALRPFMTRPVSFWEARPRSYGAGAYATPVAFLHELGSAADVDCALRDYVARTAFRIARPSDLSSVLRAHFPQTFPALAATYGVA